MIDKRNLYFNTYLLSYIRTNIMFDFLSHNIKLLIIFFFFGGGRTQFSECFIVNQKNLKSILDDFEVWRQMTQKHMLKKQDKVNAWKNIKFTSKVTQQLFFCYITCTFKRTSLLLFRFKISQCVPFWIKNLQNLSKICKKGTNCLKFKSK